MKTTRVTFGDVRWLDERALLQAAMAKDPEAFSELIRRYDPLVRYRTWRVLGGSERFQIEQLDGLIADFWCALVDADLAPLAAWDADGGELFAAWLGALASQAASDRLRRLLRDRAAA